jgi:hypothetical protein
MKPPTSNTAAATPPPERPQRRSFPQNYFKNVACFSALKIRRFLTTIHHAITTNSPAKNHVLHLTFGKTPFKNARKLQKFAPSPRQKKICEKNRVG